jgi:hypothetical protein
MSQGNVEMGRAAFEDFLASKGEFDAEGLLAKMHSERHWDPTVVGRVGSPVEPACCSGGGLATLSIEPPAAVTQAAGPRLAEFKLGRTVAAQSGCLGCHRIGEDGNRQPGPDLTNAGSTLSPALIERALINPTEPMPSFEHLPTTKLRALVVFLSMLRR